MPTLTSSSSIQIFLLLHIFVIMQIIRTLLQTDNHASTSPLSFHRLDALSATQPMSNSVKALKAYGLADATGTPIISCFIEIQNGLPFWCWLTQVVLEKRLLNGCSTFCN